MANDLWGDLGYKPPSQPTAEKTYDPQDLAVRLTLLEEKDPTARQWVAGVMANRAKARKGDLLGALTEKNAFEPFSSKRAELDAIDPNSDEYKQTAAQIIPILTGKQANPAGEAMNFYAPDAQAELAKKDGRPVKPEFDDGTGTKVGSTLFFGGKGAASDSLWGSLGYDPNAKPSDDGPQFDADHPKMIKYAELSPADQKTYKTLYEGGVLDPTQPQGSEKFPFFSTDPKQLPAGAYYVADGKVKRTPGGTKESSALAGLQQGAEDVATSISHVIPGSDDSDIKNALIANQMVYGAKYGGDLKSGAGRFTGQVLTSAPVLAAGGEIAAPVLKAAGPVGEFLAGQAGRGSAPLASRLLPRAASLATAGAETGAGGAALTASANPEPLAQQVAEGAAGGAVAGPIAPVVRGAARAAGGAVRGLIAPLTAKGQEAIVDKGVARFTGGAPLALDLATKVPGSQPTMAEAAGDAGLSILEKQLRANPRTAALFEGRSAANNEARLNLFSTLRGDEHSLQALEDARDAATAGARDAALKAQTKPADIKPVLDAIDGILAGPEGKRSEVVKALNEVRATLHDAKGNPETTADMLYGVRKGIDDLLSPRASSEKRGAQLASSQLIEVKKALDNAIQDVAPGFKEYLADYSKLSKPINEQNFLQSLKLTDTKGTLTLARVQSALDKITDLKKRGGVNDAKAISQGTLDQLTALRDDLKRAGNIDLGKPRGSDTNQNLIAGNLAAEVGLPIGALTAAATHHPIGAAAFGAGKLFYNMKEKEVLDRLANRLLFPQAGPRTVVSAKAPGKIAGAVRRLATPVIPAAGGIIANRLVGAQ